MRTLTCPACGLTYGSATASQRLLSSSGASCPRCRSDLREASRVARPVAGSGAGSTTERHRAAMNIRVGTGGRLPHTASTASPLDR
jgi:hypothetical protein